MSKRTLPHLSFALYSPKSRKLASCGAICGATPLLLAVVSTGRSGVPLDDGDVGVMGEAVEERRDASGMGEDRVPLFF